MTWLIIILVIIGFIFGKFLLDRENMRSSIVNQGGMNERYRSWINWVQENGEAEITKLTSDNVTLTTNLDGLRLINTVFETFKGPVLTVELKSAEFEPMARQVEAHGRTSEDLIEYTEQIWEQLGNEYKTRLRNEKGIF